MTHIPKGFKKTLIGSLIFHFIFLSAFFLYRTGSKRIFFSPVYTVNLVEPSRGGSGRRHGGTKKKTVKRKRTVKKPPAIKVKKTKTTGRAKSKKKADAVKKKTVALKKKAKPATDAVSIAEALKKIKRRVKEQEESELFTSKITEIKGKRESQKLAPRLEDIKRGIKGARTGQGAGAGQGEGPSGPRSSGLRAGEFEIKHKAYFVIIRDRINENWFYPEGFNRKGVSVIVSIRIGRNGELLENRVEKTSGNRQFDLSLLHAVKKSAPFPPLPVDFEGEFLETGLRFCPECEKK